MENIPYVRIGTSFYKLVKSPTIAGHFNEQLVTWSEHTIKQDHGKDFLSKVPKYDGFTCIPNHLNFKKEYHRFYNIYSPLSHMIKEGIIDTSLNFVEHIFGNQKELGLDFLSILFTKPTQILPILCLVSKARSTGKSSFLKWLKEIFENNLTYLTNDSFGSQFNADWANKLLICIDEVLFNKEELTERIKYLSTTNRSKLEAKGKDKREVEFFGKFILCSNNEDNFIKIDANETRFWVRKVPLIIKEEHNFLEKLISEIPAFLYFLSNRPIATPQTTRMWFTSKQIYTPALKRLVMSNRNRVEKELASLLITIMEDNDLDKIDVCPTDLLNLLSRSRVKVDTLHIRRILKKEWAQKNQKNCNSYDRIKMFADGTLVFEPTKGRYYTITKEFLQQNFDDLMNDYE